GRAQGADRQGALEEEPSEEECGEEADTQPGGVEADRPGEQGQDNAERRAERAQDRPENGGGRVFLRDQVHEDHHHEGMGNGVNREGRRAGEAGEGEAERGARPPGRRGELPPEEGEQLGRAHRLAVRSVVPPMVATAEAPRRNESSGSSTWMRTGKRAWRRIQSIERSTRGRPLTLVPFSGRTAQPRPTTVPWKPLAGSNCRYRSAGAPAWMWRSWVSRKLATTYQVRVSTRTNTSPPARAKAPSEMLRLTTLPVKGATTRQ